MEFLSEVGRPPLRSADLWIHRPSTSWLLITFNNGWKVFEVVWGGGLFVGSTDLIGLRPKWPSQLSHLSSSVRWFMILMKCGTRCGWSIIGLLDGSLEPCTLHLAWFRQSMCEPSFNQHMRWFFTVSYVIGWCGGLIRGMGKSPNLPVSIHIFYSYTHVVTKTVAVD